LPWLRDPIVADASGSAIPVAGAMEIHQLWLAGPSVAARQIADAPSGATAL
jgi:hypothetical protein